MTKGSAQLYVIEGNLLFTNSKATKDDKIVKKYVKQNMGDGIYNAFIKGRPRITLLVTFLTSTEGILKQTFSWQT